MGRRASVFKLSVTGPVPDSLLPLYHIEAMVLITDNPTRECLPAVREVNQMNMQHAHYVTVYRVRMRCLAYITFL